MPQLDGRQLRLTGNMKRSAAHGNVARSPPSGAR